MIHKKTLITVSLVLLFVILVCLISVPKEEFLFANTTAFSPPQIIIDAGHGGLTNTID